MIIIPKNLTKNQYLALSVEERLAACEAALVDAVMGQESPPTEVLSHGGLSEGRVDEISQLAYVVLHVVEDMADPNETAPLSPPPLVAQNLRDDAKALASLAAFGLRKSMPEKPSKQLFLVSGTVKSPGDTHGGGHDMRLVEAETEDAALEAFGYALDSEGFFVVGEPTAKPVIRR